MDEIWRDITGYEGYYQVSNLGNVRSCERKIIDSKCKRIFKGKILKPTPSKGKLPYYYVSLSKQGKIKKKRIHVLVASEFIPNPEHKPQVNHKNGNPQDNRIDNLEWVTNSENTQHAYNTGLRTKRVNLITYNGKTQNIRQWCLELGLNYKTTYNRLKLLNWSVERAFGSGGD